MRVTFIHRGGPKLASYRLRTAIPAQYLGAQINTGDADVIVFSKPVPADVEVARQAKGQAKIVVDVCDPHDYSAILQYADHVVVSSEALKELHPTATVIPDPIEGDGGAPHATQKALAWVGHHSNLGGLRKWLDAVPVPVAVCTTPGHWPGAIPWSEATQKWVYTQAGIILVPAGNRYKSANRVAQAIHEGCFVIASNIPAYEEFKQFAWVGEYPTGIRWADHNEALLNEVVGAGQSYVRKHYSPEAIGARWKSLLDSI